MNQAMKTFFTFIPRQPEGMLKSLVYDPQGNDRLTYGETHFPIIPVIHGYSDAEETIRVIAVVEDYANCKVNAAVFQKELDAAAAAKNLKVEFSSVQVPYDDSVESQLTVFRRIIGEIRDGDDLHMDITFGSKPSPIVETMALRYARQIRKNTFISCVVYGQFDHNEQKAKLYDETALLQLDGIVNLLGSKGISDPDAMLNDILDM